MFPIHKAVKVNFTFIEALAHCRRIRDLESEIFLEYILLKYFDNNSLLTMTMKEASLFLANGDLDDLLLVTKSLS